MVETASQERIDEPADPAAEEQSLGTSVIDPQHPGAGIDQQGLDDKEMFEKLSAPGDEPAQTMQEHVEQDAAADAATSVDAEVDGFNEAVSDEAPAAEFSSELTDIPEATEEQVGGEEPPDGIQPGPIGAPAMGGGAEPAAASEHDQADGPGEVADAGSTVVEEVAGDNAGESAEPERQVEPPDANAEPPSDAPPAAELPNGYTSAVLTDASVGRGYGEALVAYHDRGSRVSEEYRHLRDSLLSQSTDQRFCYAITSAEAGEGKTVTCLNLALVLAEQEDCRAIVVDCDLQTGRTAQLLNCRANVGLTDVLRGRASLAEVIQPTVRANLAFIPAGRSDKSGLSQLASVGQLKQLIDDLREDYDYVLVDGPAINISDDACLAGQACGRVLLVARMNKTPRQAIEKAIRLLHAAKVELAGMVLTHRTFYMPEYLKRFFED